jgi:hypothetical protein
VKNPNGEGGMDGAFWLPLTVLVLGGVVAWRVVRRIERRAGPQVRGINGESWPDPQARDGWFV